MPDLKIDIPLLLQTFTALNECASALQATDATVEYSGDSIGHVRLRAAVTAFVQDSTARRERLGRETERLAAATQNMATKFLLTDAELARVTSRTQENGR